MKFPFQNLTAQVIAEAISETELRRAARAAGITPEDAKFLFEELLFRLESDRASFDPAKGHPLFWARRTLFFLFRERRKKNHILLSTFDPKDAEEDEVFENRAEFWFCLKTWQSEQRLSAPSLNLPDASELAERENFSIQQARNKICKLKRKAAAMAESGASLDELAAEFNHDNPELCRNRKPKTPQPPKGGKK